MARLGRPPIPHPRRHGAFLRFSDTEWGALQEALAREHPVASRRPSVPEWIRDLIVAHASEILEVDVTRSALRAAPGGARTGSDGGSLAPYAMLLPAVENNGVEPLGTKAHNRPRNRGNSSSS